MIYRFCYTIEINKFLWRHFYFGHPGCQNSLPTWNVTILITIIFKHLLHPTQHHHHYTTTLHTPYQWIANELTTIFNPLSNNCQPIINQLLTNCQPIGNQLSSNCHLLKPTPKSYYKNIQNFRSLRSCFYWDTFFVNPCFYVFVLLLDLLFIYLWPEFWWQESFKRLLIDGTGQNESWCFKRLFRNTSERDQDLNNTTQRELGWYNFCLSNERTR